MNRASYRSTYPFGDFVFSEAGTNPALSRNCNASPPGGRARSPDPMSANTLEGRVVRADPPPELTSFALLAEVFMAMKVLSIGSPRNRRKRRDQPFSKALRRRRASHPAAVVSARLNRNTSP